MIRVVLKDRGQLTIPAKLRKILGLRVGDLLEIEVRGGYIVLKPLDVLERGPGSVEGSPVEGPGA
jgi:AbrB family looped-hinge helix DNA binding protein